MNKKNKNQIVGVLGGMGSYATLHFFEKFLEATPAEKEWDRPRIIIDNRCTMPSRVRAILYKEERPLLVKLLADSVSNLIAAGATDIVLACNTSHVFLDEVFEIVPEAKDKVRNIIKTVGKALKANNITKVGLVATEGTILSGIFEKTCIRYGVTVIPPSEDDFDEMRYLIEAVKHNDITEEICIRYVKLLKNQSEKSGSPNVILGCTEFPCIQSKVKKYKSAEDLLKSYSLNIWDPLQETIKLLTE